MSYSGMRFVDKLHADYDPCLTPVWGLLTSYRQTTIHVLLRYEVCWQVTRRLQSISYSGMRFIDKIHEDYNPCLTLVWGLLTSYMQTTIHLTLVWGLLTSYNYNPCLTPVWGLLTSYTQTTIHVLLRYEVCWQVTRRLQSMSYSGMRFVDKLHADYNPRLTPLWGLLTSYTHITIHFLIFIVLLRYEVRWQVTDRLQSMSNSGMRFVDRLHADYNPCLTPVWGLLTSYTQIAIHVLLRYEACWQVTRRLQSMSYSGMRFVDKLHTDYNPYLTLVWGLLTSYTQITIHVLLWYEVCWQVTHRLQSMSYSGMRFVDKIHTDYNPCLTPVWGLLTSYTQTTIHVLLRYEVRWKVTRRLQSMSYSGMRFVDKLHADYNWCLTPVWGLLTSYTQITIHVLLRYEVCWQVTRRLQSMSYSGMRFVDKLHADYNPCLTPVWGSLTRIYNPCLTPVWGLLTSYTQITIHVLLRYEVCWQVTRRLQSMSYSGMRFVDRLHADYNPYLTPVWGLLTRYTQTTIHDSGMRFVDKLHADYNPSYSGMRFVDKLHADYNPCLTPVWGLLTSYTQTTIHVLLRYEVCWQVTRRLQSMSYSGMRFVDKWQVSTRRRRLQSMSYSGITHRLQSMSYYGMRLVDKLHADYNPCLTPVWGLLTSYTQITIHVLLWYEVCWQVTHRLQSMSYSGMRFVDKLHADYNPCLTPVWGLLTRYTDYNPCLTPVWGLLTSYTQTTIHVLLRYEVHWKVTRRLQSMSYSGKRFVDKLHADYNPCLTPVWGLLTSYTQITIHVLLRYEVCWQVTRRLQSMSYSGMRFVDKLHADYDPCLTPVWGMRFVDRLHADYNPYLTPVWGLLTRYTQTTIHVLLRYEVCWQVTCRLQSILLWYEVCWQVTRRLQSMSYSGMRFVDKLHADYNPCLTPVWGLLTSYTQTTIHVLLRYEVCWQVTRTIHFLFRYQIYVLLRYEVRWQVTDRLQSMSNSGMRFVDRLHADYNPCLTPVWGLLTSYTQIAIHVLLRYEACWQVTRRLQSMSYSGMRFVDKLHTDYNPYLTLVWGLLTSYTQITIHVLLWYEVCWQLLQSMSYSGMRFVDKIHTDYNPCLTPVWGLLTSYTQTTIHVLLRYEVRWKVTRRLQSMSYSGMRFVDKLHTDYNPCLTPVWGLLTSYTQTDKVTHRDYNPCLTPVWGLLTSYTQTTIHVLLRYEVCWQVTRRLQSMSYSGMRFVDKLHADYNPCLTPVWGLLTGYTQTTIHILLRYEVYWQVTRRLQSMSYSGMRFVDKLHADTIHVLDEVCWLTRRLIHVLLWYEVCWQVTDRLQSMSLRYEVCWQVTRRLQSMSYSSMRFVDKLHTDYNPCLTTVWGLLTSYTQATIHVVLRYEVCWQVTHRLQSMSYSGMRFVDKLHTDYNPCLTLVWGLLTSYTQTTIHVLLRYEVCWQVTQRLQSMSYSGMRFVDKLHTDYNPCLTPVWSLLTSYTHTIHVLLRYEVCWQVTHRLQSMSYSGMRFVDKLHADYNCLTPVWGLLTSYTQITIHVLLRYEVCWQVTGRLPCLTPVWGLLTGYTQTTIHILLRYEVYWQDTRRLQSMSYSGMRFVDKLHADYNPSYSGMRFVDKLHADYNPCLTPVWGLLTSYKTTICLTPVWGLLTDYNPCLTPVWGLLTSYTRQIHVLLRYEVCWQVTIHTIYVLLHVLLRYEVRWQVTDRLQSMSNSGMRFVDRLHADYNPCLTPVWGLLSSYTQIAIHVLLRYEACWQVTRRLQSMSYSGMRFVDKLHTDYNPYLTLVWGLLTCYTQTTIHVLLRYEVCWQVTHRLQSMSYSGMRFVDKLHTDTIHVLLRYEVCWQVTHRLQSMSYSGMRFVDKLHADYNPCLTPVWGLLTRYTDYNPCLTPVWGVCWQVTHRLQSMSYSGMRFVEKLHADYNPCLTPVWGLLTSYTTSLTPVWGLLTSYRQTTIHVLLRYEVCWQVTRRLQSISYSGMRFIDKIHADYNPCLTLVWGLLTSYMQTTIHLTLVWGLLTSYTQITIHVLLRYEVCWQVTRRLQSMSYSGEVCWQVTRRLQSMSYSVWRFQVTDRLWCLTPVWGLLTGYTQTTIHVLLQYEVCCQVTHRLQSMSYYGMRLADKLHAGYNPCRTPVWGLLTSYTQITIHVLLWYEVCWQVTHRLQSMSYSGMRFVDKLHADYNPCLTPVWGLLTSYTDYNPCLTPVWGLLTSYTQTTIHVLLRYEVCWQVTRRLQSMSYSGMRFVDKLHADYNPCLTPVWGLLISYTQTTIHVLLRYEVCWQVTRRLRSMSYSGMRFVDKLQADYNPCLTPVWGLLTSYTQTTIHILLRYEVYWQDTRRLQSMSYSGMRFVDKLHADYNPCLTPVWGLLTSYTQITIHVLLRYEVCWQVTRRLQSMSYSGMRFVDKLHADYNPCLTPLWGLLTSYTHITIHFLFRYQIDKILTPVWGSLTSYSLV